MSVCLSETLLFSAISLCSRLLSSLVVILLAHCLFLSSPILPALQHQRTLLNDASSSLQLTTLPPLRAHCLLLSSCTAPPNTKKSGGRVYFPLGLPLRFQSHIRLRYIMKQPSKDPFEAAYEEERDLQEQDSPVESPNVNDDVAGPSSTAVDDDYDNNQNNTLNNNDANVNTNSSSRFASTPLPSSATTGKNKDEEEEDEEENMDVELGKFQPSGDPDKMAKMQAILSQFTEEQMSRYESFRRSGFQKANMKKLLASLTGSAKISIPMTIVVSGIAKMFVGELVETARVVMTERKETGPIRPCHIREAYRRLKLEGKIPKRSVPRLFR